MYVSRYLSTYLFLLSVINQPNNGKSNTTPHM